MLIICTIYIIAALLDGSLIGRRDSIFSFQAL